MKLKGKTKGGPAGDPLRAQVLVHQLWSVLEAAEGRTVSNQELSEYLKLSDTALSDWASGRTELYQIEALLKLCERVHSPWREEILARHLRVYPILTSPVLSHDPVAVGFLGNLLRQERGLTFLTGGNCAARTFLFTALGQSYVHSGPVLRRLAGWDAQSPDWFIPVPGLVYLNNEGRLIPGALREATLPGLVMSNGLWTRFQDHRQPLLQWCRSRHVVVADENLPEPDELRIEVGDSRVPVHRIQIEGDLERIHVRWTAYRSQ